MRLLKKKKRHVWTNCCFLNLFQKGEYAQCIYRIEADRLLDKTLRNNKKEYKSKSSKRNQITDEVYFLCFIGAPRSAPKIYVQSKGSKVCLLSKLRKGRLVNSESGKRCVWVDRTSLVFEIGVIKRNACSTRHCRGPTVTNLRLKDNKKAHGNKGN